MALVRIDTVRPHVSVITLDNPSRLNSMSFALVGDLYAALDEVGADNDCRVVILTGAGRGFCSGLELEHAWCGIDGETPDHLPLIGPVAELPGLYLATGFSLGGFQLAPAVGRLVGDEILGGAAQGGLSGLRPSRFGSFEPGWLSSFQRTQRDTPKW